MTPHNILYINLIMLKCNQYDVNCTVHDVWRPTIHQVKHIARSKWLEMLNFRLFSKLCKSPSNTYRKQIKQTASGTIHELEMKLHKSNISLLVIQTTGIWVTVITQCYAYVCLTQQRSTAFVWTSAACIKSKTANKWEKILYGHNAINHDIWRKMRTNFLNVFKTNRQCV